MKQAKQLILLYGLFLSFLDNAYAQSYQLIHHYTIDNGLPSNMVYNMEQDSLGNLWLATNNGVSRYDGKYFRNFTYKDGLPSNDVVYLKLDAYGVLWLNCFGHKPTYYENDAFHILKETANQITNQNYKLGSSLENEAMYMSGSSISGTDQRIICQKNKRYKITRFKNTGLLDTNYYGKEILFKEKRENGDAQVKVYHNKICTDSFSSDLFAGIGSNIDRGSSIISKDNKVHEFALNKQFNIEQRKYVASTTLVNACFLEKYFILLDASAMVFIYDRNTQQLLNKLQAPLGAQCAFVDKTQQLWVGTKNDGLYCYAKSNINRYLNDIPNNNFLSVFATKQSTIIAGNGFCQTHEINKGKHTQFNYTNLHNGGAVKYILPQKQSFFMVEDNGILKYKSLIKITGSIGESVMQFKSGLAINDSVLFVGTVAGAGYLNTNSGKFTDINFWKRTRVYACAMNEQRKIYFTETDKINKIQYPFNKYVRLPIHFHENELPISLTLTHDNLLWIATNESRIYVVNEDRLIDTLTEETALLQNLTHITSQGNQIVVSSKSGLAIINYTWNGKLKCNIRYVTQQDGLPSGVINQAYMANDSIYVATENGIGVLHKDFTPHNYTITSTIQSIRINNELVALQKEYLLKAGSYNISMQLSGVDLSGHLFAMQYALNDTSVWNTIEGNQLSLILRNDETKLFIRSRDNQNKAGKPVLACTFDVAIPFYRKIWFWVLCVATGMFLLFWWYTNQQQIKLKREFDKQLALQNQRKKLTADLHDDLGATLSSLQVNSNIANKLLSTDVDKAGQVLSKIESQSQNLADKIGDFIWSMKPGKDEFMSLSNRIKTFASDILGSTNIHYVINIDTQINDIVNDASVRKNIVLITKEAINNAVKYSHASNITIEITLHENYIHLCITDDGIGMDKTNLNGNGLQNMRKRTEDLSGTFEIISSHRNGTKIVANIPYP